MKIAIVGGHLSPALAVIEELPKDVEVIFFGRKHNFEGDMGVSLEYKTIASMNIPFVELKSGRLQRKLTKHTISSLAKLPVGFASSIIGLKKHKPDAVLSFGGYLSLPIGFSANILGIPLVIHEQTLEAGLANRILAKTADKVCVSWMESGRFFPKDKTILTGNPIRRFRDRSPKFKIDNHEKLPVIYITGGSAGSHFINMLVEKNLEKLLKKYVLIHQTGDAKEYHDFDRLSDKRDCLPSTLKNRYYLIKFVDPGDVGSIMESSDLVIGRSGANTVNELVYFKKPSIMIPIPFSQRGEQLSNAMFLKKKGLGEIFYQDKKNKYTFTELVSFMIDNAERYRSQYKMDILPSGGSAKKIVEIVLNEAKKR